MPVIYGNKKITPAPVFNLTKELTKTDAGDTIGTVYSIQLQGTIVAYKGSPRSLLDSSVSGVYWDGYFWTGPDYPDDESIVAGKRLAAIERKQEALRSLFSQEGLSFEVQTPDGSSPPIKCNPRIRGPIQFSPGIWTDRCDYTIDLEADVLYMGGSVVESDFGHTSKIRSAQESWQTEEAEFQGMYRVTHTINAVGKKFYDSDGNLEMPAWQQARRFALETSGLGFSSGIVIGSSGLGLQNNYTVYNQVRTEVIDETGGAYSVTETYLLQTGIIPATETYNITDRKDQNNRTTYTIDGTIQGLYNGVNRREDRFSNAKSYYNGVKDEFVTRILTYAGGAVNPIAVGSSVVYVPNDGVIQYSYEYNNRPVNFIDGAITESIEVVDLHPASIIAQIPVLGRLSGPVLQDVQAKTARQRNISIQAAMPASSGTTSLSYQMSRRPNTDAIVSGLAPLDYRLNYTTSDQENWDFIQGLYSRQVTYTWEKN